MLDLQKAVIENEKSNYDFGIDFETLKTDKKYHNKIFFDKWGIPWKYINRTLYYNDCGYKKSLRFPKKDWNEAYIQGAELPYKRFFTPEQFETIKPSYLCED